MRATNDRAASGASVRGEVGSDSEEKKVGGRGVDAEQRVEGRSDASGMWSGGPRPMRTQEPWRLLLCTEPGPHELRGERRGRNSCGSPY